MTVSLDRIIMLITVYKQFWRHYAIISLDILLEAIWKLTTVV